ncbi:hypothetical protein ARSEF4850_007641, partial [Beauveria asiatica]
MPQTEPGHAATGEATHWSINSAEETPSTSAMSATD